jgi:hypothetical protein
MARLKWDRVTQEGYAERPDQEPTIPHKASLPGGSRKWRGDEKPTRSRKPDTRRSVEALVADWRRAFAERFLNGTEGQ